MKALLDSRADNVIPAISSNIKGFENAVICETATRSKVDCIVTLNAEIADCNEFFERCQEAMLTVHSLWYY